MERGRFAAAMTLIPKAFGNADCYGFKKFSFLRALISSLNFQKLFF